MRFPEPDKSTLGSVLTAELGRIFRERWPLRISSRGQPDEWVQENEVAERLEGIVAAYFATVDPDEMLRAMDSPILNAFTEGPRAVQKMLIELSRATQGTYHGDFLGLVLLRTARTIAHLLAEIGNAEGDD